MSKFVLGTVQFGLKYGINNKTGQPAQSTVFQIFDSAREYGIQALDTAEAYGNAHEIIGQYHHLRSGKFKINTKFSSVKTEELVDQVIKACDTLAIDCIDTYFFHSFIEYKSHSLKSFFDQLISKGQIKNIGVSVYTNEEFEAVINDPFINVIQIPFNLFDNFSQRGKLILKAKTASKIIQIRSIFLQGLFFIEPDNLKGNTVEFQDEIGILRNIAQDCSISISDLCIQYACHYPEIDHVIIGVDTLEQLKSNINSGKNVLSSDIVDRVNKIHVRNTALLYPYNWK
jgi:aryl-alcohol dehydrogenase-like predicted oxidoreductase